MEMKKTIYELTEEQWMEGKGNNWLKMHGFVMFRHGGKRKRLSTKEKEMLFK